MLRALPSPAATRTQPPHRAAVVAQGRQAAARSPQASTRPEPASSALRPDGLRQLAQAKSPGQHTGLGPMGAQETTRPQGLLSRSYGWVATRLLGPEVPAYAGQIPGATGRVANRLAPGESAMITATATTTVPSAAMASWFPGGATLPDLGGSVRMAGMLARRADGQLNLTLTFQSAQSASVATSSGLSTSLAWGDRRLGLKLGADASAGAEVSQVVVATLRFDPTKPEDVKRLRDLMEPDVAGLLSPFEPRLVGGTALQRAMQHHKRGISVGGTLGGNVGGTVGAALGELDPTDGKGLASDSPWSIKAKLGLLGSASSEVFRTWAKDGSVSDMVGLEGGLEGSLKLTGYGRGKASERQALAFNCTHSATGELSELSVVHTEASSVRGMADLGEVDAGFKKNAKEVVTRSLNAAGLAEARRLVAQGHSPFAAFRQLSARPELVEESRVVVAGRSLMFGLQFDAALAGQSLAFGGLFSMGKNVRRSQELEDPGLRELLSTLKGTMAQAPRGA